MSQIYDIFHEEKVDGIIKFLALSKDTSKTGYD